MPKPSKGTPKDMRLKENNPAAGKKQSTPSTKQIAPNANCVPTKKQGM